MSIGEPRPDMSSPKMLENIQPKIQDIFKRLERESEWGGDEDNEGMLIPGEPDFKAAEKEIIQILPSHEAEIEKIFEIAFFQKDEDRDGALCKIEPDFEYAKREIGELIKTK